MSDSVRPYGQQPTRLLCPGDSLDKNRDIQRCLCPWNSPDRNTGVDCQFLLQGIFPTEGLNTDLLHCRQILYHLSHQGNPQGYQLTLISFLVIVQSLSCGRRLFRVPWTTRSNQSILKKISPEYSLEGLMMKLKCQYFGHLMHRTDSLEKTLMLGKIEGRRRRGR